MGSQVGAVVPQRAIEHLGGHHLPLGFQQLPHEKITFK